MKKQLLMMTMLLLTTVTAWAETIDGVKYIDASGVEQTKDGVTVLTGGGSDNIFLAGGWYVVNSNISYSATIYLQGDVHLILADGKTMNIGTSENPISGHGIEYSDYINGQSLTIYSQSGGTGALNVYVTNIHTAICARNVTINGGIVNATTGNDGIFAIDNVIINGGQVTASGGGNGIRAYTGDIVLGWTKPTDFIEASSFRCENFQTSGKVVKTADGKVLQFTDGDNTMKLIGDITDLDAIKNQKLTPYGIGGYCGTDDTKTTDVDESKTLTWDIALKDEPTSATDLATTLTIEGSGTMATYTNEAPAPWSNKTIEAANILASADVANVNAIAGNIPVTLGYTGPVVTTHTFNGYFVRKTADDTNISANVLSHNDQTDAWTLTMPDYAVNVSPKLTRNTTVSVEIVDPVTTIDGHPLLISGDDAHVKVTLVPVAGANETTELPQINGYVTISVDDGINLPKPYYVAIVDGEGHYYVTNLGQSVYDITASFDGDDNYTASATEDATTLEVCKILTEITCSLNKTSINVGEALDVTVKINEVGLQRPVIDEATNKKKEYKYASSTPLSVDAVVTIKAGTEYDRQQLENNPNYQNNNYTFGFTGGQGTKIFSHLPAGTRYFRAVYAGDDKFTQSECQNKTLIVNKKATTIGVDVTSPVIAKEQNYE